MYTISYTSIYLVDMCIKNVSHMFTISYTSIYLVDMCITNLSYICNYIVHVNKCCRMHPHQVHANVVPLDGMTFFLSCQCAIYLGNVLFIFFFTLAVCYIFWRILLILAACCLSMAYVCYDCKPKAILRCRQNTLQHAYCRVWSLQYTYTQAILRCY